MSSTFTNGYALLIGIGECTHHPKLSLPTTVKDIQALHQIITNPTLCAYPSDPQHIQLRHDDTATRSGILEGLQWLQTQSKRDPQATVIVYYSGHGWLDQTDNTYHLLPSDLDPFDFKNTALSAIDFTNALRKITSQRLLVVIDSCHAAGMATAKKSAPSIKLPPGFVQLPPPKQVTDALRQGKGRVVLTSSQGNESSWILPDESMSLFTYHFIEALQGAASSPGDTTVKISHLMNHLSTTVPKTAQKHYQVIQTPFFDLAAEDFAISSLCGGKGLSTKPNTPKDLPSQPHSIQIQSSDDRVVVIGRDANQSTIITGDGNNIR